MSFFRRKKKSLEKEAGEEIELPQELSEFRLPKEIVIPSTKPKYIPPIVLHKRYIGQIPCYVGNVTLPMFDAMREEYQKRLREKRIKNSL